LATGVEFNGSDLDASSFDRMAPFCSIKSEFPVDHVDLWASAQALHLLYGFGLFAKLAGRPWEELNSDVGSLAQLAGDKDNVAFAYGEATAGCGIQSIDDDGEMSCSGAISASALSMVSRTSAFAAHLDRVYGFDGELWTQFGDPLRAIGNSVVGTSIWASGKQLYIGTDRGVFFESTNPSDLVPAVLISDEGVTALWGSATDDVWSGDGHGRISHFDGTAWTRKWRAPGAETCPQMAEVLHVWGDNEVLFVLTRAQLLRQRKGKVETLMDLPCDGSSRFWALSGTTADDVNVALEDSSFATTECGTLGVLHFDGSDFTQL
jgi:hypothetical protein